MVSRNIAAHPSRRYATTEAKAVWREEAIEKATAEEGTIALFKKFLLFGVRNDNSASSARRHSLIALCDGGIIIPHSASYKNQINKLLVLCLFNFYTLKLRSNAAFKAFEIVIIT